jgi:hypothetical protein
LNKKAIVLFITLFFIIAFSILIMKNLDDTDKYIQQSEYQSNINQVLISIKNTQEQFSNLLSKHTNKIKDILEEEGSISGKIPLSQKELNITFNIKDYDKVDVNIQKGKENKALRDLFNDNGVYDYAYFVDIYHQKVTDKIKNNKQLLDIINNFIIKTNNYQIKRIENQLGFLTSQDMYELDIEATYYEAKARASYVLDTKGEVRYFDISFN